MPMVTERTFKVRGMSCEHCVRAVEDNVGKLHGVSSVEVDLETGEVRVKYNAEQVDIEAIEGAIAGAGYDPIK